MMTRGYFVAVVLFVVCAHVVQAEEPIPPVDVRAHGAKGDGVADDTHAIQKAIEAAAEAGGGRVLFPAGRYLSGSVRLRSNVELHLAEGARWVGIKKLKAYLGFESGDWGKPRWNRGLIVGEDLENIAITGEGVIDGNYHDPDGAALLVGHPKSFPASLDLTAVLGPKVQRAVRTYAILEADRGIEMTDRWTAAKRAFMMKARLHTEAQVTVDGLGATLARDGKKMRLTVDGPEGTQLVAGPMSQFISELDRAQEGMTVIDIRVPTEPGASKKLTTRFELLGP